MKKQFLYTLFAASTFVACKNSEQKRLENLGMDDALATELAVGIDKITSTRGFIGSFQTGEFQGAVCRDEYFKRKAVSQIRGITKDGNEFAFDIMDTNGNDRFDKDDRWELKKSFKDEKDGYNTVNMTTNGQVSLRNQFADGCGGPYVPYLKLAEPQNNLAIILNSSSPKL